MYVSERKKKSWKYASCNNKYLYKTISKSNKPYFLNFN